MVTVANLANQPPRSRQLGTSPFAQRKGAEQSRLRPPHGTANLGANPANSCPLTPLGFLERAATVFGDCPSVVYHDTVFTWSQTHRRCLRLASALVSLGISRGDIVSVLLPNVPAMYEMHFGVPMSGAVLNTINTRLDAHTVAVLLRHSGSKLVFVDPASLQLIRDALQLLPPGHPAPRVIPVEDPHEKEFPAAPPGTLTYERLLEIGDPEFAWVRPASEWDPMVLNYTSGTTSAPKGVVHCHRGLFLITLDSLVEWAMPRRPTYLWTLPMFHANGWSYPWGMAVVGGTNVCLRRVNAATVYAAIASRGVTHLCCAPVVLNMLANAPEGVRRPLPGKIRDRSKDVIINAGENISSVEVESVLYGHPAANKAAVVARPDELRGETPCAFISLKEDAAGTVTAADVLAWCRERMPHYMVPRTTSTGKIQKYVLRNLANEMGPARKGDCISTKV
ncbi:putative acyl-activating enzyme 6 [Panicum miliaceum]|uniref:4-coumarate--CoA ligase n=1 Tax=Panicum miliaceum TaxID=4540 RepID=A0A3L6PYL4_PANMI|nr:putative acyl-activating enzyme 6 [Panicum miliaceum]